MGQDLKELEIPPGLCEAEIRLERTECLKVKLGRAGNRELSLYGRVGRRINGSFSRSGFIQYSDSGMSEEI